MIAIIASSFNQRITDGLLKGCLQSLTENNFTDKQINIFRVPGAFEIPAKVKYLAKTNQYDTIIALGSVIKGETDHYHYISQAVTNGIMSISLELENKSPYIFFGILTCQNKELAIARSGDDFENNKGYEVGLAAISQLNDH